MRRNSWGNDDATIKRAYGINNSTAKNTYSFGKESRFMPTSQYNATNAYNHKSAFKGAHSLRPGGFGVLAAKRFSAKLGVGNSDPRNFSPEGKSYFESNFAGMIGKIKPHENRDVKNRTAAFSFGVGRSNMKKNFVHKIAENSDGYLNVPGSGTYEPTVNFGGSFKNQTSGYTLRKKFYEEELALDK